MKIIINNSLMVPIYEQITDQIKLLIRNGELKENDILPSVRILSKELKISALTVKKAYDFCLKNRKRNWKRIWNRPYKKADATGLTMRISKAYLN